jgi:hypothetical protein
MYGVMACISVLWVIAMHWGRRQGSRGVEYIELDNLWKDEENGLGHGKMVWRLDIWGMARDGVYLLAFIAVCFVLQIFGIY